MILLEKKDVNTMTSNKRVKGLHTALLDIYKNNVHGDIVECGVYKGGNIIIAKVFFDSMNDKRKYHCFDTFTGMVEPGVEDGPKAKRKWNIKLDNWCRAFLDEVKNEFKKHNVLDNTVSFIEGDVSSTLLIVQNIPEQIALLRLDTDWYESTILELKILYPKLVPNGYLIIDDYGHWKGAKKAVDEYFGEDFIKDNFIKLDYTGIMFKKR